MADHSGPWVWARNIPPTLRRSPTLLVSHIPWDELEDQLRTRALAASGVVDQPWSWNRMTLSFVSVCRTAAGINPDDVFPGSSELLRVEISFPGPVPDGANHLRFHASDLSALQVALAYGRNAPPPRLAVGFAETKPKGKTASPGLYFQR
jgi:hypothetical protein